MVQRQQGEAFVLRLLRLPYIAALISLHLSAAIAAAPLQLYLLVLNAVVGRQVFARSRALHALLWLPRWLGCTLFPLFAAAYVGGALYATHAAFEHEGQLIATISTSSLGIGLTVSVIKGLFFPGINVLPPVDLADYGRATLEAQSDLLAFIATFLVTITLARILHLVEWVKSSESFKKKNPYLAYSWKQLAYTLMDYLCLPFLLLIGVTVWRIPQLRRLWREHAKDELKKRLAIVATGINVLMDLPFALVGLVIFGTFWRAPALYRELSKISVDEWRGKIMSQFLQWLLDIPFIAMALITSLAIWGRTFYFWKKLHQAFTKEPATATTTRQRGNGSRHHGSSSPQADEAPQELSWRQCIGQQFICAILDIPAFVCFLLILITLWNLRPMLASLKDIRAKHRLGTPRPHLTLIGLFFNLLLELPFIVMVIVIGITLWRLPRLIKKLRKTDILDLARRRTVCYKQFFSLLLDIPSLAFAALILVTWHASEFRTRIAGKKNLSYHWEVFYSLGRVLADLPYHLSIVFVGITLWRSLLLWRKLRSHNNLPQKREVCLEQALCVLFDIPCLIFSGLLLITVWEWSDFRRDMRSQTDLTGLKAHFIIVSHTGNLIQDSPALLCLSFVGLTLWRVPEVRRRFQEIDAKYSQHATAVTISAREKRHVCYEQAACTLLDLFALLATGLLFFTRWHWSDLIADIRRIRTSPSSSWYSGGLRVHGAVFKRALSLLVDLPFFICLLATFVTFWRLPVLFRRLCKTKAEHLASKRKACVQQFVCGVLDIPAILFRLIIYIVQWNARQLDEDLQRFFSATNSRGKNGLRFHAPVYKHFALLVLDLPYLIAIVFIAVTLWRLPTLVHLMRSKSTATNDARQKATTDRPLSMEEKRQVTLIVLGMVLLDLLAFMAYLAVRITVWHYEEMKHQMEGKKNLEVHALVFRSFGKVLLDAPYFFAIAVITIAFWRLLSLRRRFVEAKNLDEKREACIIVLLCVILDPVALVLGTLTVACVWHASALLSALKKSKGLSLHKNVFYYAALTVVDLPFIVLTVLTSAALWRIPSLYSQFSKCRHYTDKRSVALVQFQLALLDIVVAPLALIVLVTIWNARSMVTQFRVDFPRYKAARDAPHIYGLQEGAICHTVILYNFALLLADLPFLLLLIPLTLGCWRGMEVLRLWRRTTDYWTRRKEIAKQFLLLIFDTPAVICFAILLVSWRSFSTIRKLKAVWIRRTATMAESSTASAPSDSTAVRKSDGARKSVKITTTKKSADGHQESFHGVIFSEMLSLLLDAPFIAMSPFLLWRLPGLLYQFFTKDEWDTDEKKRLAVVAQLGNTVLDVPFVIPFCVCLLCPWRTARVCGRILDPTRTDGQKRQYILASALAGVIEYIGAILVIVMAITLWRIPSLIRIYHTLRAKMAAREKGVQKWLQAEVGWLFVGWLQDIPYIPLFIFTLPMVWRSPIFIQDFRKATTDRQARSIILGHAEMVPVDILCGFVALLIGITLWRLPSLALKLWRTRYTAMIGEMSHWHEVVLNELLMWVLDLLQLLQVICIVLLIVQAPALAHRLWRFTKLHSEKTGFSSLVQRKKQDYWRAVRRQKAPTPSPATAGLEMPDEVILRIFSYLEYRDLAMGAGLVCSQWWCLAEDESLWRDLLLSDKRWPGLKPDSNQIQKNVRKGKTFKQLFRYKHMVWQNRNKVLLNFESQSAENDYKLGYRYIIHQEFFFALKRIHHTLMLPIKLLGYLLSPLLRFLIELRYRFPMIVVLGQPSPIQNLENMNNFWWMQLYFLCLLANLALLLYNDLLLLLFMPIYVVYFIATLGSPLWRGRAPSRLVMLLIYTLTGITMPFVEAYVLTLFFSPLAWPFIYFYQNWSTTSYWQLICAPFVLWAEAAYLRNFLWRHLKTINDTIQNAFPLYQPRVVFNWILSQIIRVKNAVTNTAYKAWIMTVDAASLILRMIHKRIRHAVRLFRAVVTKIATAVADVLLKLWLVFQKVLGGNNRLLARITKWCYANGTLGNLLLTFAVPMWMFWPICFPIMLGSRALYIPAVILCFRFFITGYKIVDRNWGDKEAQFREHKLKVESVTMEIGPVEEHGIRVHVRAAKPKGLELKDYRLHLEGKRFWGMLKKKVGAGLIGTFKMTMHPLNIKPFMVPDTFPADSDRFDTVISFGTEGRIHISKPTIMTKLKELKDAGDHELDLRLEYGDYNFGWTPLGTLAVISTRPSQMLALANTPASFPIKPPPDPASSSSPSSSTTS